MDGKKKVVITCGKDGSVRVEAEGFKGGSCEEATAFLDNLFGVEKREYKSSYYEKGDTIIDSLSNGYCG